MDSKTLEALFLSELNSLSDEELIDLVENSPATGLGDLLHEDAVYSCLEVNGMNVSSDVNKTKYTSHKYLFGYTYNTSHSLSCIYEIEPDFSMEMAA
jgi:hypothetical protein